jgi:hypothetical protein
MEDGVEIESELDTDVITVGRHPDSIIVLPSGSVSSHHATIKRRGEDFYVQDLGTTNGTKLNGVDVEEAKLDDGDKITFGDVKGIVHLTDAPPNARSVAPPVPDIVPPSAPPLPVMKVSKRKLSAQKRVKLGQYKESTGCASFLMFLVLMIIAFAVGLHVRHNMETGGFLLQDVAQKLKDRFSDRLEQPSSGEPPAKPPPATNN